MGQKVECPSCGYEFSLEQTDIFREQLAEKVASEQTAVLNNMRENLNNEMNEKLNQQKKESEDKLEQERRQNMIEKERNKKAFDQLQQKMNRETRVELSGEAAEERLKKRLQERFPGDEVIDIKKGVKGADLILSINPENMDNFSGKILIEVKNTSKYSATWIPKIKEDLENTDASVGLIVTNKMPKEKEHTSFWKESQKISVLRFDSAIDMIAIIRDSLINDYHKEIIRKGSNDERMIKELYDYMTSSGIEHLQSLGQSIMQTQKLIQDKEKEHSRMIKKEKKNLEDQIKICRKLGSELQQSGLSNLKGSLVVL